ncbi:GNAT family N-acetyltransferase [Mycetohabitans endofungorum]|uniref:GNAT family N-acetyltransferase n=1 Tax=Mycetohabitans endofungorum TaxID=417203 RepID=UPI002B051A96|nr:GNAT family N-acetyltransferase [Mycetohabitans endofungorum]
MLLWRAALFLASWQLSENYIVERDRQRIGVLGISSEGDTPHIRDLQLAPEARGAGGGTFLLETVHAWARQRCLRILRLRVFTENHATRLYARLRYQNVGGPLADFGMIKQMERIT